MNSSYIIIGMLILSILAPFVALYAVKLAKEKKHLQHKKLQQRLFFVCATGVLLLELQIRLSGGSGTLVKDSTYLHTNFFKITLWVHIIGAVLTYLVWGYTIFKSKAQAKKRNLPGQFSFSHRKLGYFVIFGLFYTAITASMVCAMAFFMN